MSALLCADNVHVRVGSTTILEGVSLDVFPGEVVGLIGPNGAGKSTLLSVLSGDLVPSAGHVEVAGASPREVSVKQLARLRAVMLQDVSVAFAFLVRDVVEMGRRPWGRSDDDSLIDAALTATGVTHLAGRDITTLSGGERARVALSRVLAQQTPVVLLDEPTAAMDIRHQEQSLGLVRQLAAAGKAVVVVLHDLNAAAAYCDRIVCLANGQVAASGSVPEVIHEDVLSDVYGWPIHVTTGPAGVPQVLPSRGEALVSPELASLLGGAEGGELNPTLPRNWQTKASLS